jgi:GntR family transcriptional regulator, histidine utilization repressor
MKPAALHERIRAEIEAGILSGALPPGSRLPFETELMARYGCARMTVSKALGALARAGLLERRKRAGTFVARPKVHSMVLDVPDLGAQVRARGDRYRFELLERRLVEADRSLHLRGRHFANDRVFALEDRLVNLLAVPAIAAADFSLQPPGTWLLDHVPWTEAENRISAIAVAASQATLLDIAAGAACLEIARSTWRGSDWITRVTQCFPGDAYDLVARFGAANPPSRS